MGAVAAVIFAAVVVLIAVAALPQASPLNSDTPASHFSATSSCDDKY